MQNIVRTFSSFAVDDMTKAKDFYQNTLGLDVVENKMGFLDIKTSSSHLLIYPKPDHKPAEYTVFNLVVQDIETAVTELLDKGVKFEVYPGYKQDERGISRGDEGPDIAWFKDPAGNILSVFQGE